MKPIFRWTVGNVSKQGLDILRYSIKKAKQLYDPECVVCHNNVEISKLPTEVRLVDQNQLSFSLATPIKEVWKLVPPRLDISRHELFIDNDLVLFEKVQKINKFLEGNATLLLNGQRRFFGQYDSMIPKNFKINSGLFGVPPNFDLEKKLKKFFLGKWIQDRSIEMFDDQGIITLCLLDHPRNIFITEQEIFNCDLHRRSEVPKNVQGLHFINANREPHKEWLKLITVKFL